jgi:hypothetical protein
MSEALYKAATASAGPGPEPGAGPDGGAARPADEEEAIDAEFEVKK